MVQISVLVLQSLQQGQRLRLPGEAPRPAQTIAEDTVNFLEVQEDLHISCKLSHSSVKLVIFCICQSQLL